MVIGALLELSLTAALLSNQNKQFDQQISGREGDVRPPDNRIAQQVDTIVVAGEELALFRSFALVWLA